MGLIARLALVSLPRLQDGCQSPLRTVVAAGSVHRSACRKVAAIPDQGTSPFVVRFDGTPVFSLPARRRTRQGIDGGMRWYMVVRGGLLLCNFFLCLGSLVFLGRLLCTPDLREYRHSNVMKSGEVERDCCDGRRGRQRKDPFGDMLVPLALGRTT